jgi:hypothetical protein
VTRLPFLNAVPISVERGTMSQTCSIPIPIKTGMALTRDWPRQPLQKDRKEQGIRYPCWCKQAHRVALCHWPCFAVLRATGTGTIRFFNTPRVTLAVAIFNVFMAAFCRTPQMAANGLDLKDKTVKLCQQA